jgi:hypothetical protein
MTAENPKLTFINNCSIVICPSGTVVAYLLFNIMSKYLRLYSINSLY